jgi:P27 family predicted phage terminase small subunit
MPRRLIPAHIHKMEKGTLYGDLAERVANEPKPIAKLEPKCPSHLNKAAKKEWRFFKKVLQNYGLFNIANAKQLEMLAIYSAQFKECVGKVESTGIIILSPNKMPIYSPYFTAMNTVADKMQKCLGELGLSSSGLAKLGSLMAKSSREKVEMETLMD